MDVEVIRDPGIALGLGLPVGLQREWSHSGLSGIRTLSGPTDMDAISLSSSQLMKARTIDSRRLAPGSRRRDGESAGQAGAVVLLGHRRLLRRMSVLFAISLAGGVVLMLL